MRFFQFFQVIVIFYVILISIIICTNIHRFRRSKRRKNFTKLRNAPLTNSKTNKVQDAEFYHEYYRLNQTLNEQTLSKNGILAKETLKKGTDQKCTKKVNEKLFLIKKKKNAIAISVSNHHQQNCTISALCNQDQRYLLDHHSVKTPPSFSSSSSLSSSCSSFTSCSSSEESSSAFYQEKDVEEEKEKKEEKKEEQEKYAIERYHSIVMDINDGKLRRRDAEEGKEKRKKKVEEREDERKRKERVKRRKREARERKREEFIPLISINNNHHRSEHGSCQHL